MILSDIGRFFAVIHSSYSMKVICTSKAKTHSVSFVQCYSCISGLRAHRLANEKPFKEMFTWPLNFKEVCTDGRLLCKPTDETQEMHRLQRNTSRRDQYLG